MGLRSVLRKRLVRPGFMVEGRALHQLAVGLSLPVEAVLGAVQRRVAVQAPIFIMGPQRSGTTLFYKCFLQHQQVCSMDQAAEYFPERYLAATALFKAIHADRATDFLETFDAKKDLWIRTWKNNGYYYTEGNRVWNRLGPNGRWLSDAQRRWAQRAIPALVSKIQRAVGRPVFMSKCPANALRIGQLCELFPNARFIHIERDPRGVINSIVNVHRALNVRSWGPMPVPAKELEGLSEYEAVAHQWVAITDAIRKGLASVPAARRQVVRYEDFMGDVQGTLDALASYFGLEPFRVPVDIDLRMERKGGWRTEIPASEIARIEQVIARAGYADRMGANMLSP